MSFLKIFFKLILLVSRNSQVARNSCGIDLFHKNILEGKTYGIFCAANSYGCYLELINFMAIDFF